MTARKKTDGRTQRGKPSAKAGQVPLSPQPPMDRENHSFRMERDVTVEFLRLINACDSRDDLIRASVEFFQGQSACEAAGIRLFQGEDYPYREFRGFPGEFIQREDSLCRRDDAGNIVRDERGQPVLECLCGCVVSGQFGPLGRLFTAGGSFWTNDSADLVRSLGPSLAGALRGTCPSAGYQSIALIPLRVGQEHLGLVHLNSERSGRFSPQTIEMWERLTGYLAVALSRLLAGEELRRMADGLEEKVKERTARTIEALEALRDEVEERKRVEGAMQASEKRFRALVENLSDAIALINAEGNFIYASPAVSRINGYSPQDFLGKNALQIVHPEDAGDLERKLRDLVAKPGSRIAVQFRICHRDGSWRWLEGVASNQLQEPAIGAIVVNYRDITDRKLLEDQLRQSQKMEAIGRLAGGVAHDFRNQLTVVQGYGEMLLRRGLVAEEGREKVEEILKAAQRSATLANELLVFSRQQMVRPEVLNLNEQIANMCKSLARMLGEDIRLSIVPASDLRNVKADGQEFQNALMNLAVNARDAMPHGGELTIETVNVELDKAYAQRHAGAGTGPHVMVAVSDTGEGMDAATMDKIFEPFFTTKPVGKGTGLGLAMVYGFMRQCGGHVTVSSEVNHGTTFKLYFPCVHEAASGADPAQNPKQFHKGTGTILVVEDEPAVREFVVSVLEECGYFVLKATGPQNGLEQLESHSGPIDLLITDVVMPDMSGPELASRSLKVRKDIPVLFMSGYTNKEPAHREVMEKGSRLLVKPFRAEALAKAVREILANTAAP